jgi:hypothetical protein
MSRSPLRPGPHPGSQAGSPAAEPSAGAAVGAATKVDVRRRGSSTACGFVLRAGRSRTPGGEPGTEPAGTSSSHRLVTLGAWTGSSIPTSSTAREQTASSTCVV